MLVRFSTLAMSAMAVVATAAASQAALLTYDVRVTGASSGVTVSNTKSATVANVGDVVHLAVYGVLSTADTDTTNDGISSGGGSVLSGAGGLLGTLGQATIPSTFQGTGFSGGTSQDLDVDGDADLGSNGTASSSALFKAVTNNGTSPVQGSSLLLGTFDFTVTSLSNAGTTINFRPAALTTGTTPSRNYHIFTIDGTNYTLANSSNVGSGTPVAISIAAAPEPASLAAIAISGVGMLRRRRRA